MGYRSKNKKEPDLSSKDKSFISACSILGLSADDALALYQILETEEEVFYFSIYALGNMFERPAPVDVILAACEIKEELENQKRPHLKHLL